MSAEGKQRNKETLIEMIKLSYSLTGKGKGRKRTLHEILEIINDKETYFSNLAKQNLILDSDILL